MLPLRLVRTRLAGRGALAVGAGRPLRAPNAFLVTGGKALSCSVTAARALRVTFAEQEVESVSNCAARECTDCRTTRNDGRRSSETQTS
jgi:hypothetical protein